MTPDDAVIRWAFVLLFTVGTLALLVIFVKMTLDLYWDICDRRNRR